MITKGKMGFQRLHGLEGFTRANKGLRGVTRGYRR